MAKVKVPKEDIKQLSTTELLERVKEDKAQLLRLKFNHTISPIENPKQMKGKSRNIARYLTELKQREMNPEARNTTKKAAK